MVSKWLWCCTILVPGLLCHAWVAAGQGAAVSEAVRSGPQIPDWSHTDSHVRVVEQDGAHPPFVAPTVFGAVAALPSRRRLRVVLYARYSTDEQSPRSIDDQLARCKQFIDTLGLDDCEIVELRDAAVSGEVARRPGIDQVLALIETDGCDVIVAEDMARFYRHSTRAMRLVEAAVELRS